MGVELKPASSNFICVKNGITVLAGLLKSCSQIVIRAAAFREEGSSDDDALNTAADHLINDGGKCADRRNVGRINRPDTRAEDTASPSPW